MGEDGAFGYAGFGRDFGNCDRVETAGLPKPLDR
jgi:hypothetical protein